jgi:hypothetical protein
MTLHLNFGSARQHFFPGNSQRNARRIRLTRPG